MGVTYLPSALAQTLVCYGTSSINHLTGTLSLLPIRGVQRAQQGAARALFPILSPILFLGTWSLPDFRKGKLARVFLPKKYQQYFFGRPELNPRIVIHE